MPNQKGKGMIDHKTVIKMVEAMEAEGEVTTLEMDYPNKKNSDEKPPLGWAAAGGQRKDGKMTIVVRAGLAHDGPEVRRPLATTALPLRQLATSCYTPLPLATPPSPGAAAAARSRGRR